MIAQSVKYLLPKYEDLSSILSIHINNRSHMWHCMTIIPVLERQRQGLPGTHWPVSLDELYVPDSVRDPVSKISCRL